MSNLIDQLRKARTAAEVAALIPQMQVARIECQRRLDELEISREDAVLKGGQEIRTLKERVRDEQEQLSDWDAAMRAADRRLADFRKAETASQLEASAKRAQSEMKRRSEVREKFMSLILEASALRVEDANLTESIRLVHKALSEANRPELDPVDELMAKFLGAGFQYQHPITYAGFQKPLAAAHHFLSQLAEIEKKAA